MARFDGTKAADTLFGAESDDELFGYDGDDLLDGGAGADRMDGGIGDDSYVVDDPGDALVEAAGAGKDRVLTALGYLLLAGNVEDLSFTGTGGFTGIGNSLANRIEGGGAADMLDGGTGGDTLVGKGGDDLYVVDDAADAVVETAGEGNDTVNAALLAYALPDHVENIGFTGTRTLGRTGTGNALANRIVGMDGNDILDGGAGADVLVGGYGNDIYHIDDPGDAVQDAGAYGWDTIRTTLREYELPQLIERLIYAGDPGLSFYGIGNGLDNQLVGGAGDDVLDGRAGMDQMFGLGGNDRYHVDNGYDEIGEEAGGGVDAVYTTRAAYTLPPHVENLFYEGDPQLRFAGTGNGYDNRLYGGASDDRLDGASGADTLSGGLGDDEYWIDNEADAIVEQAWEGRDTAMVTGITAFVLSPEVEDLEYLNTAGGTLTGNAGANRMVGDLGHDTLRGLAGADTLDGRDGNDLLEGGADDDILYGNDGNDTLDGGDGADALHGMNGSDVYIVRDFEDAVYEVLHNGTDEVRTALGSRSDYSRMYTLPDNVEILTGTSSAGQGVYGNSLDNLVRMGGGDDLVVLHHGGIDRVEGGGGDDFLYFGDTFTADDRADGGAGYDTVGLLGTYSLTLAAVSLAGIEKLAVYSSGIASGSNSYRLTTVDANVAAGRELMVVAQSLLAGEVLFFDGSAESDGRFNILGGRGADTLTGGGGADRIRGNLGSDSLRGGGGNDVFDYYSAAESAPGTRDRILDFSPGDRINLVPVDADANAANGNSRFAFIGANAFGGVAGQLRLTRSGPDWVVEGDVNGDGHADLVILVTTTGGHSLSASDFWL